ncbi:MAG TPA: hypothetical protein VLT87_11470 [Thermoanaerobaculia bacterium]|nr:hypothetical protein [Thermoanaerobaculia bacterium]
MPELAPQSTPPTVPSSSTPEAPPDDPPPAIPPIIDPARFEDFPAYREIFLLYVTDPAANAALRAHGTLTYDLILDFWGKWPDHPEGFLRAALRAAVADLRCIEGFLLELEEGDHGSRHENLLAAIGAEIGTEVGELADKLEEEMGPRRGEV